MPSTKRSIVLAASVAGAALAAPAIASADSIVYLDHGDVWSAKPDGSAKVQLTTGGDWHSPTQADDGTLAAVEGSSSQITVMARDGRVVRRIQTAQAPSPDGGTFQALPRELAFSPDGSKIAYSYAQLSCPVASTCGASAEVATLVTDADVDTASPKEQYGYNTGVDRPSWASPTRVLASGGANVGISIIDLPSSEQGRRPWITPSKDIGDPALSRDGHKLAVTYDYGDSTYVGFIGVRGDGRTDADPEIEGHIGCGSSDDKLSASPSWSPDSSAVTYANSKGIWVVPLAAIYDDHCDFAGDQTVLSATGSEPTWGPADPPAARYVAPGATTPAPGATTPAPATTTPRPGSTTPASATTGPIGGAGSNGASGAPAGTQLAIGASTLKRSALRTGRATVRVSVGRAGTLRLRLSSGRTTITTGRVTVRRAGKVTVRLPRASRKALAALSGRGAVLVSATLTSPGADRLEGSRTVGVR